MATEGIQSPTGFFVKPFNDNYILDKNDFICFKSLRIGYIYPWSFSNSWTGRTVKKVRSLGYEILMVTSKEKPKPRFECDKPFPYGY